MYFDKGKKLRSNYHRAVSKISRRWVNTTSKWGIITPLFIHFSYGTKKKKQNSQADRKQITKIKVINFTFILKKGDIQTFKLHVPGFFLSKVRSKASS